MVHRFPQATSKMTLNISYSPMTIIGTRHQHLTPRDTSFPVGLSVRFNQTHSIRMVQVILNRNP